MSNTKFALLFFGGMSIIGIGLSSFAFYFWQSNHHLKTEGVATVGTVVGYKGKESYTTNNNRRQYSHTEAAVVEFVDGQGQKQTIASDVYTSPRRFSTGARVKLWYAKDTPQKILIAGTEEWLLITILGVLGLLLSLAGIPNFVKTLWTAIRPKP